LKIISSYKLLNNPYDGNSIGAFKSDVTREFDIKFCNWRKELLYDYVNIFNQQGWNNWQNIAGGVGIGDTMYLRAVGNFSYETAPTSISALICISY